MSENRRQILDMLAQGKITATRDRPTQAPIGRAARTSSNICASSLIP
jgi:hypothetical protein